MRWIAIGLALAVVGGAIGFTVFSVRIHSIDEKPIATPDAESGKIGREMLARDMEKFFLDQGINVQCVADEAKRSLLITGPSVNRVFAHHVATLEISARVRGFGFTKISFSNDKSGFSDDYFAQDFDITGVPASKGTVADKTQGRHELSRTENAISVDTTGCTTFDQMVALVGSPTNSMPGCIDLDLGEKVIGPLEIRTHRFGDSNSEFARIRVPGKGERWTFLAHLEKEK